MKKISTFLALLLGSSLFILGGLSMSYQNLLIASNPLSTQGVITRISRERTIGPYTENLRVAFKDSAGKEHEFEEKVKPAFRSEGQTIKVNYYKPNPSLATASDNQENAEIGIVIIIIGLGLLALSSVSVVKSLRKR